MMGIINNIRLKVMYGHRSTSDDYIRHLRKLGCKIGGGTIFFDSARTLVDETRPCLIDIGENVQITRGVTILTHGYDWAVLKGSYGDVIGSSGEVVIGNNVFIGMNTTILKGVHIGSNCIIGANSLVNKSFPDNSVIAGNPAKFICALDEYYQKRLNAYEAEAIELVKCYRARFNQNPKPEDLHEFFWLFTDSSDELIPVYKEMNKLVREDVTLMKFQRHTKKYKDMNEFLDSIPWEKSPSGK